MGIEGLIGGVASWKHLTGSCNDDWVDRLNHLWTVMLLILFGIFVTTSQFAGDPIHCWTPAQFPSSWVDYTKSVCWVSNTYYIPIKDIIPIDIRSRKQAELQYYQWIPLILMFMALMFKLPNVIWRVFNDGSGVNLDKIVDMAEATQLGSQEDREKTINHIAVYMDRWLESHRDYKFNIIVRARQRLSKIFFFICAKREGTYLTGFYVLTKAIYLANVVSQFFLLNKFLAMDYHLYGAEVITQLLSGEKIPESPRFPRVTLCDFEIRLLQNILRYTVQCVLPINLFSEKIFMFVWFWLVLVATITTSSLLFWVYRIMFRQNRVRYVKKYLKILNEINGGYDKQLCQKFGAQYLRDDGIFVLRVIGKNSTDLVVTDLLSRMWKIYKDKPYNKKTIADTLENSYDDDETEKLNKNETV